MSWKKTISDFFVFSRGERRGILLWAVVMVLFILAPSLYRIILKDRPSDIAAFEAEIRAFMQAATPAGQDDRERRPLSRYDGLSLFPFDPNKNSYDDWLALGFTSRQARTASNYLKSGGRFTRPSDLKKIYGLEPGQYGILEPYIFIDGPSPEKQRTGEHFPEPERIVVPVLSLEINSADSLTLLQMKGIGPVLASRLIKYRNLLGGFHSCSQLSEVYGLSDSLVASWEGKVWADTTLLRIIDLNQADYPELLRHPYLNSHQARAILRYRTVMGRIDDPDEIIANRLIPVETYRKLRPYLLAGTGTGTD